MAMFANKSQKRFYCAFCKTPRSISAQKHVGFFEFFLSAIASVLLMLIFFAKFDFKIIPIFAMLFSLFEFFVQIKHRLNLSCPHCGFDPVLYMKSREKACAQVISFLDAKKNDPTVLMSSKPKLNLPIRKVDADGKTIANKKNQKKLDIRL